jgi:hypothetical protein
MALSELTQDRIPRYNPHAPGRLPPHAGSTPNVAAFVLPDEPPGRCQTLLDSWLAEFPPAHSGDRALIDQLVVASRDREHALDARSALLTERIRTAELRYDQAQQQQVDACVALLPSDPVKALAGLNQTAAGTRYQIQRWERLEAILKVEGCWYGQDRAEAIMLQGARAGREHMAGSEAAYITTLYCIHAAPEENVPGLRELADPAVKPKQFMDHHASLWMLLPTHARELLGALVSHHLGPLRAREEWLRIHIEDPGRAASVQAARVLTGKDLAVLRAERLANQSFHQAYQALLKGRRTAAPWACLPVRSGAFASASPSPSASVSLSLSLSPSPTSSLPGRLLTSPPGAFFDYHSARRAALEELDVPIEYII